MLDLFRRGKNYFVQDVNHAVAAKNVGDDDVGVIDHHLAILGGDGDALTVLRLSGIKLDNLRTADRTLDHVIGQNRGKLLGVLRAGVISNR
jgi:hypothetical protein